ncbi:MAG TPA: hypothetical protein P5223_15705, partial [Phycisphaerae bacterium]|nr:hypothetical protein [Phycisphaerae bacterium]
MSAKSKVQPGALASVETARTESYQPLVRLSIMMFVEFAVWGAWSVLLGKHMEHLGFSGKQIGLVYLTTAL